jgi:hypothetical protein
MTKTKIAFINLAVITLAIGSAFIVPRYMALTHFSLLGTVFSRASTWGYSQKGALSVASPATNRERISTSHSDSFYSRPFFWT